MDNLCQQMLIVTFSTFLVSFYIYLSFDIYHYFDLKCNRILKMTLFFIKLKRNCQKGHETSKNIFGFHKVGIDKSRFAKICT